MMIVVRNPDLAELEADRPPDWVSGLEPAALVDAAEDAVAMLRYLAPITEMPELVIVVAKRLEAAIERERKT